MRLFGPKNTGFAITRATFFLLAIAACPNFALAQDRDAIVFEFGDQFGTDFQFSDIGGFTSNGVNAVGNGDGMARLVQIAPGGAFSSSELLGVRDITQVNGISSDGFRIAGNSVSNDFSISEATTWLSTSPGSGIGLGFGNSSSMLSTGVGASSNSIVGSNSGGDNAFVWSASDNQFDILADSGGISEGNDTSIDGSIIVGFSSDFGAVAGATYWDDSGINQLDEPFGRSSEANAISPNAQHIGGELEFFDAGTFETGTQAAVWSGSDFDLTLLEELDGAGNLTRLLGSVNDVSASGYAVGAGDDGTAFIWHPTFDGINSQFLGAQDFDDWLLTETGITLDTMSISLAGISEDLFTGDLHFAVNGSTPSIVTVRSNSVPEPSALLTLLLGFLAFSIRRKRS